MSAWRATDLQEEVHSVPDVLGCCTSANSHATFSMYNADQVLPFALQPKHSQHASSRITQRNAASSCRRGRRSAIAQRVC